jgi:hypothetical protein
MNKKTISQYLKLILAALSVLAFAAGCSEDNGTAVVTDRVLDPLPLALGNSWQYTLEMSISVAGDTIRPTVSKSALGLQSVSISRTEAISGDESYGLRYFHVMGRLFDTGADTTVETHYVALRGDEVLQKAIQINYGTGGFVPLGRAEGPARLLTKISVGGTTHYISLENLARLLLAPSPGSLSLTGRSGAALASDGIQNDENSVFYDFDYILLYSELFKGRKWISQQASGAGGVEVSQKVTNVLPSLSGIDGPIAEVEESSSFIETDQTTRMSIRNYYKGGVGLVQAEIYDPEAYIVAQYPDSIVFLGVGTWQVVKKLAGYTVK